MTWVLDTSAVICWLNDEPGAERMEQVLIGGDPIAIHAVNMVEVAYILLRRSGEDAWQHAIRQLQIARVTVVRDIDDQLVETAAQLKAYRAPIALGDIFAVALAVQRGATLLTTDRGELEKVAAAGICDIEFLR